jgi:hypothetical protein
MKTKMHWTHQGRSGLHGSKIDRQRSAEQDVTMFELEQFTADCRAALAADKSHKSVREVVARVVSDPAAVLKGLGEPKRSEVQKLYYSAI